MYPELGAAGSFYARSVTPQTPLPAVLPDASTIFDGLPSPNIPRQDMLSSSDVD